MLSDGREIEGVGIQPDMEVKAGPPAEFAVVDPVLEAALAPSPPIGGELSGRTLPGTAPGGDGHRDSRTGAQSQAAQAL